MDVGSGKTSVKYQGKTCKRYRAGSSPDDKKWQKEVKDKKAFLCECGTDYGKVHDLGCDLEQCPICKGQLLSCGHGPLFLAKGQNPKVVMTTEDVKRLKEKHSKRSNRPKLW